MASVYTNNLTLTEIATGEQAGVWGFTTNVNLELIGEAMGSGTYAAFPTDADSLATLPNGATSGLRSIWLDLTSQQSLSATRILTIGPNTISRLMFIQNSTTGGQTVTIGQGSGATVDIPNGQTKAIILSGAGATAAVTDAFLTLSQTQSNVTTLNVSGDADIGGFLTASQTTVAMTTTPVLAATVETWVGKRVVNTFAGDSNITLPATSALQTNQSIIIMVLSATTNATMTITPDALDEIKFADPSAGTYSGLGAGVALDIRNGGVIELQKTAANIYTAFGSGKA
jgi:hypothetical protein